jgi:hypothetical protein
MSRLSSSRALVVILAAGLLASLATLASYASVDRKTKKNHHPTVITNKGKGPALVLRNRPGNPPMQVGSTTKVPNLNADQVDGVDAAQLEPDTFLWTIGKAGQEFNRVLSFPVPSGWYDASVHVSGLVQDAKTHLAGCFVYPKAQVDASDYTNMVGDQAASAAQLTVSAAGDLFVPPNDRAAVQCIADGVPTDVTLLGPVTLTLRPIEVVAGPGSEALLRQAAPQPLSSATHR